MACPHEGSGAGGPGSPRERVRLAHPGGQRGAAQRHQLAQDVAAHGWIIGTGLPIAVVATKMDKLARADRARTLKLLPDAYGVPVLSESALKHDGMDDIWKLIRRWAVEGRS